MKKQMTTDECCAKIAKAIVKDYKMRDKDKPKSLEIFLGCHISTWTRIVNSVESHVMKFSMPDGTKVEIPYQEGASYQRTICDKIWSLVSAKVKLSKGMMFLRHYDTRWERSYGWYSNEVKILDRVTVVRPCRQFFDINKKLMKLGLKPIDVKEWWSADVSGKRSSIFSKDYHYKALRESSCAKVLAFLKGKKKLSYEYTYSEDCEDREYGERYETEWYGHTYNSLTFTDAQGKKYTF